MFRCAGQAGGGPIMSSVTVKAPDQAPKAQPPAQMQEIKPAGTDPLKSAVCPQCAPAAARGAVGHLPMALSCLIQRGAFFAALMAA